MNPEKLNKIISKLSASAGPTGYNVKSGLMQAWSKLTESVKIDGQYAPLFSAVDERSTERALSAMISDGLYPIEKQCYLINERGRLAYERSYLGKIEIVKRTTNIIDINAEVVFDGDTFQAGYSGGYMQILEHSPAMESEKIKAAYAVIIFADGRTKAVIMPMKEIQKAWDQSRSKQQATHKTWPGEMAKRTVINRALKPFLGELPREVAEAGTARAALEAELEKPVDIPTTDGPVTSDDRSDDRESCDEVPF